MGSVEWKGWSVECEGWSGECGVESVKCGVYISLNIALLAVGHAPFLRRNPHLPIYLPIYLSTNLSTYLSTYLPMYINLSFSWFVDLSIYLSVYLFIIYPIPSYLSYLILSYLILSHLILSSLLWSYPIRSYHILSYLILSDLILFILSYLIWSYPISSYLMYIISPGVFQPRNLHLHSVLEIPKQRIQLHLGFATGFSAHILLEGHIPWQGTSRYLALSENRIVPTKLMLFISWFSWSWFSSFFPAFFGGFPAMFRPTNHHRSISIVRRGRNFDVEPLPATPPATRWAGTSGEKRDA